MKIDKNIENSIATLKKKLAADENFDVVYRTIKIASRDACLFFIDGYVKDEIMEKLMEFFESIEDSECVSDAHTFAQGFTPYVEVGLDDDVDTLVTQVLSGVSILLVDGFTKAVAIDARTYPQRATSEPDKDKVLRGSKDGFVETLIFNTALLRRRIRDPALRVIHYQIGRESKTDVALCYLNGRADEALLKKTKEKLKTMDIRALTMNQETLAEALVHHKWYNPFPKFKYTERPDTTAAQVLEGDIVLLVDNSPSALIMPVTLFDVMEEANDYYFPPITGTYLRLTRFLVTFLTMILTPTWLLLLTYPDAIPEWLEFIKITDKIHVPIVAQLLILEFAIDGLKLASLNTPSMLTTSLSMIGAIVVGDFAVKSGWFCAQSMLYMALVAIANYAQPGYELSYALKFMRLILLALTGLFGVWGYIAGHAAIILILVTNKTVAGTSYLYPLIPFNAKEFKK
ncbi:MAG: spore germination protein, partial [Clostridia bacterium]